MTAITATRATLTDWAALSRRADDAIADYERQAEHTGRLALELAAAEAVLTELAADKDTALAEEFAAHQSADATAA